MTNDKVVKYNRCQLSSQDTGGCFLNLRNCAINFYVDYMYSKTQVKHFP